MAGRGSRHLSVLVMLVVLAGCGSGTPTVRPAPPTTTPAPTTTATTASVVPAPAPTSTAPPPSSTSPQVTEAEPALSVTAIHPVLDRAGGAGQAVLVIAGGYGSTTGTLTTWQRADRGWVPVHGPWPAWVGRAGFAPPGEKREGDGRTPSGTYGFDFAFGVQPDPGLALPYRRVTGPSIVWDDVPSSPTYNQWVDGGHGEAMYVSPAYDYGAAIAYNPTRTPGLGSAIFLHESIGRPTSGCVSLPADRLLEVLRWLDPARSPVIVMGVS